MSTRELPPLHELKLINDLKLSLNPHNPEDFEKICNLVLAFANLPKEEWSSQSVIMAVENLGLTEFTVRNIVECAKHLETNNEIDLYYWHRLMVIGAEIEEAGKTYLNESMFEQTDDPELSFTKLCQILSFTPETIESGFQLARHFGLTVGNTRFLWHMIRNANFHHNDVTTDTILIQLRRVKTAMWNTRYDRIQAWITMETKLDIFEEHASDHMFINTLEDVSNREVEVMLKILDEHLQYFDEDEIYQACTETFSQWRSDPNIVPTFMSTIRQLCLGTNSYTREYDMWSIFRILNDLQDINDVLVTVDGDIEEAKKMLEFMRVVEYWRQEDDTGETAKFWGQPLAALVNANDIACLCELLQDMLNMDKHPDTDLCDQYIHEVLDYEVGRSNHNIPINESLESGAEFADNNRYRPPPLRLDRQARDVVDLIIKLLCRPVNGVKLYLNTDQLTSVMADVDEAMQYCHHDIHQATCYFRTKRGFVSGDIQGGFFMFSPDEIEYIKAEMTRNMRRVSPVAETEATDSLQNVVTLDMCFERSLITSENGHARFLVTSYAWEIVKTWRVYRSTSAVKNLLRDVKDYFFDVITADMCV